MTKREIHLNKLLPLSMLILALILIPVVIKNPYTLHLFIMTYIACVLGMSFSMIYSTALITLGAAAFYGIGAYASTLLTVELGLSFWAALPLASIITGIIALSLGLIIVRTGTFTFVILTMLFSMVVVQAVGSFLLFGGWGGFINIPGPEPLPIPFHRPIEFITHIPYYYLMLFLLLLIVLIFHALHSSRIGRAWMTIKQSARLAQALGINVYRYRVLAFAIASSASGMVGSFYAHYFHILNPYMFGGFTSIYIQIYAALGGLEYYILGPVIGAAIMIFGFEFFRMAHDIQPIIFGALLVAIICFFPGGIIGTIRRSHPAMYTKANQTIRRWLHHLLWPTGDKS